MTNEELIRTFAEAFDPPLSVCRVEKQGDEKLRNGWMASGMLDTTEGHKVGITAIVSGKRRFRCYPEFHVEASQVTSLAKELAKWQHR